MEDEEVKVEEAVEETPVIAAEDGIEELKRRLDEEKKAREEAETRAQDAYRAAQEAAQREREARERATKASTEVEDVNLTLVKNAIDGVKRDQEIYKANYRAAMAAGDFDAAADAQEGMSVSAAKLLQLENGKTALENAKTQPQEPERRPISDPVEALAAQLSPRSAAWVRRNPQFARDERLYRRMIAAHEIATGDGLEPDSDDYFAAIETTLRLRQPAAPTAPERQTAPPAAPVNRESRPGTVRLSAEEREMAQMMGMTDKEYAQNKQLLIKEGRVH
jgi:hypothetical protein